MTQPTLDLSSLEEGKCVVDTASRMQESSPPPKKKNVSRRTDHSNDSSSTFSSSWPRAAKRTIMLRLCFIASMMTAAAVCGTLIYRVTTHLEENVAVKTYESIASSALVGAQSIFQRKQASGGVLSTVLSHVFPDPNQWPAKVGLKGYTAIAKKVAALSSTSGHGFMVVVQPGEEATAFEAHAQQMYQDFDYPETAGWSDFGFGIYGKDPSSPHADQRFHDVSGRTVYDSEYSYLVPFFQHSNTFSNPNLLLMNIHQQKFRGQVLDSIMACAEAADPVASSAESSPSCGVVTDFTEIFVRPGPAAVFFEPIFPADSRTKVAGFIGTSIHWEEVLTNVVPNYVDGLDCVIATSTGAFTYVIHEGVPQLLGAGDLHDTKFSHHGHSVTLTGLSDASASMEYTLTIYPTAAMFSEFHTNIPIVASLGFVGVIVLCTAIFFLYDSFMKYESHQRQKILEMKRRFVRYVSHEIRTPLNVVCLGLDLLQAELTDSIDKTNKTTTPITTGEGLVARHDQDNRHAKGMLSDASYWMGLTGDILENAQNAVSVLNDLLNYDKIESGTFKLDFGQVEIFQLVKKTISEFSVQARNRKISLELVVSSEETLKNLRVVGDDIRLIQVFRNLISNALKFSPEDGSVRVLVSHVPAGLPRPSPLQDANQNNPAVAKLALASPRSGSVRITLQDSGVGLSKEQLGLLFREGVQFNPNKLQAGGGSGLGLCISKEIVQHHGGVVAAQSEGPGHGAKFVVELPCFENLPVKDEFDANNRDETQTTNTVASIESQRNRRILVVDDVIANSKMLVRILQRAGHSCVVATNGQEAIDLVVANDNASDAFNGEGDCNVFDTILMDYEMPILSGPEATQQIRELGHKQFIIGITGNVLADDVARFKAHGADHVLAKPLNLAALNACWTALERDRQLVAD